MATQWYCKVADQESGPYSSKQLKQMAARGRLKPDDPVKPGEDGKWVPAGWVDGLFDGAGNGSGKAASQSKAKPLKKAAPLDDAQASTPSGAGQPPASTPTAHAAPRAPAQAAPAPAPHQAPMALTSPPQGAFQRASAPAPAGYAAPGYPSATPAQPAASRPSQAARASASRPADQDETPAYLRRRRNSNAVILAVAAVILLGVAAVLGVMLLTRSDDEGETARKESERKPAAEKPSEEEIEWVDASKGAIRRGDLQVRVTHAWVGPEPDGGPPKPDSTEDTYLFVQVRLANGSQDRKVDYEGWNRATSSQAKDGKENTYARKKPSWKAVLFKRTSVYPGKSVVDILAFEPPVEGSGDLYLDLPAAAIGEQGRLNFKIPAEMVKSEPPDGLELAEAPKPRPRPAPVDPLFQDLGPERPPLSHPGTSETPQPGPSQPGIKTPDEPPDIRDLIREDVKEHGGGSKIEPKGGPDFSDIPGPGKIEPGEIERPKEPAPEPPAPKKSNPFE